MTPPWGTPASVRAKRPLVHDTGFEEVPDESAEIPVRDAPLEELISLRWWTLSKYVWMSPSIT